MKDIFDYSLYVFDLDGTILLGSRALPGAVDAINSLREKGKKVLFFTNNASRSKKEVLSFLDSLGFSPSDGEVLTAGNVTIDYIKKHYPGKSAYVLGTPALIGEFRESGIPLSTSPDIAVSSFDKTLTYDRLKVLTTAILNGAEYICTHIDPSCPTEDGLIPDSGSIAAMITKFTGKNPRFFGKPFAETVDAIERFTGTDRKDMLFIGDRVITDIYCGKKNGADAALILSDEVSKTQLAECEKNFLPDRTAESVSLLLT